MRNSIAQGLYGAIIQLQPLPWDDSLRNVHTEYQWVRLSNFRKDFSVDS